MENKNIEANIPKFIFSDIQGNRTSLMKEPSICPDECLKKMMKERFGDVCSNFNDDILSYTQEEVFNKLGKLIQICQAKERNIRPQLEQLCYTALVDLFNIPEDTIELKLSLDEEISKDKCFPITPKTGMNDKYNEYSELEKEAFEIQKRRILNIIITGAAMDLVNRGLKRVLSDIFEMDEELPHLYSKIMKINEYLNFISDIKITDKNPQQGGYEELTLGTTLKTPIVDAHGIIFPILLQESIRCLLELCISNGLPNDEKEANKIMDKADALIYSVWDERIGAAVWKFISHAMKGKYLNTKVLPSMFANISSLPVEEFIDYARETFCMTKKGTRMNCVLYDETEHEIEYDDFEVQLMQKQNDNSVINDEYFSEDEL